MEKFLKDLFLPNESLNKKTTALKYFLISLTISVVLLILTLFIPIGSKMRFLIKIPFSMIIWVIIVFVINLSTIADKKQKEKIKNNQYKFKYDPIKISFEDFKFWLYNTDISEVLYLKSIDGKNHIFEIWFEVNSVTGKIYNKKIYLNDILINDEEECIELLTSLEIIYDDSVIVYETYDCNSPLVLVDTINQLKNNKRNKE